MNRFTPRLSWFSLLALLCATFAARAETVGNLISNSALRAGADGKPAEWTVWSPRPSIAPAAAREMRDGAATLALRADRFETMGKWMTLVRAVTPGAYYHFDVLHQSENIASDATSVLVILSWYRTVDGEGEIQRDYVLPVGREGAWQRSARTLRAPEETKSVRIEFGLRCAPGGAVFWKEPRLTEVPAPPARNVRVATTRILPTPRPPTVESNTQLMAAMFDDVGPQKPDIVLFSENLSTRMVKGPLAEKAQPIPGPLTEMLSAKAKKYGAYTITTLLEVDGPLYHNTAVLIDREGRLVGKYRKVHLTIGETENGLTPGSDFPVFETDFGRIGIVTCWDNWFDESARILRLKGAEMIFMPLAGDGQPIHWEHVWRARAADNGVWLITSATVSDSPSRIIDPTGEIVADATGPYAHTIADLDLNREWRVRWLSVSSGYGEPRTFYLKERRPDVYAPLLKAVASGSKW